MDITTDAPRRVLAVTPHPDDCEGGCGGSLAKWNRESGAEIVIVLCTDGSKGTSDRDMSPEKLAAIRKREQQEAAAVLGVKEVVFLSYPDGGLEDTMPFRGRLVREIRRHKPDLMFCMDPHRTESHAHRDHRISGQVAIDAAFTYAWDWRQFPEQLAQEGLEPHWVPEAYLWGTEAPDVFVDIGGYLDAKGESLSRHASQISWGPARRMERITRGASRQGEMAGLEYAEGFRRLRSGVGCLACQFPPD